MCPRTCALGKHHGADCSRNMAWCNWWSCWSSSTWPSSTTTSSSSTSWSSCECWGLWSSSSWTCGISGSCFSTTSSTSSQCAYRFTTGSSARICTSLATCAWWWNNSSSHSGVFHAAICGILQKDNAAKQISCAWSGASSWFDGSSDNGSYGLVSCYACGTCSTENAFSTCDTSTWSRCGASKGDDCGSCCWKTRSWNDFGWASQNAHPESFFYGKWFQEAFWCVGFVSWWGERSSSGTPTRWSSPSETPFPWSCSWGIKPYGLWMWRSWHLERFMAPSFETSTASHESSWNYVATRRTRSYGRADSPQRVQMAWHDAWGQSWVPWSCTEGLANMGWQWCSWSAEPWWGKAYQREPQAEQQIPFDPAPPLCLYWQERWPAHWGATASFEGICKTGGAGIQRCFSIWSSKGRPNGIQDISPFAFGFHSLQGSLGLFSQPGQGRNRAAGTGRCVRWRFQLL